MEETGPGTPEQMLTSTKCLCNDGLWLVLKLSVEFIVHEDSQKRQLISVFCLLLLWSLKTPAFCAVAFKSQWNNILTSKNRAVSTVSTL